MYKSCLLSLPATWGISKGIQLSMSTFCVLGNMPPLSPKSRYPTPQTPKLITDVFPMVPIIWHYMVIMVVLCTTICYSPPCSAKCGVLLTLSLPHRCFSSTWTDNDIYPQIIFYFLPIVWGMKGQLTIKGWLSELLRRNHEEGYMNSFPYTNHCPSHTLCYVADCTRCCAHKLPFISECNQRWL